MGENVSTRPLPRALKSETDRAVRVNIYTTAITVLGFAIFCLSLVHLPADWAGLLIFACMAAVGELLSAHLFSSSRGSTVSVSSVISTASVFLFGPLGGAFVSAIAAASTTFKSMYSGEPVKDRASWLQRSGFNIGMFASATAFGGVVFVSTGGVPGDLLHWSNVLPMVFAVIADTLANLVILIGVIALQTGQNPWSIWKQDFMWSVPISLAGGIFGGGGLALAYGMFYIPGLVVFLLPVLSTSYSFRLYVSNTRGYVDRLEELNRELGEANVGLLETLGAVIDADDIYTYGHSAQVATYAEAIAEKVRLPRPEIDTLIKGALVHDIGKIGIMDTILSKDGPLSPEEYNLVKRHTVIGAEILSRMKGLQELIPLVKHHHERWDGKGYPDGLVGESIPLAARILTLADTMDVLCSDRPYRSTLSFREVQEEITRCSGTQFDPKLVEALFEVMQEKGRDFFKNSAANVDRNVLIRDRAGAANGVRYLKKSMITDH